MTATNKTNNTETEFSIDEIDAGIKSLEKHEEEISDALADLKDLNPEEYQRYMNLRESVISDAKEIKKILAMKQMLDAKKIIEKYLSDEKRREKALLQLHNIIGNEQLNEILIPIGWNEESFITRMKDNPSYLLEMINEKIDSEEEKRMEKILDLRSPSHTELAVWKEKFQIKIEEMQDRFHVKAEAVRQLRGEKSPEILELLEEEDRMGLVYDEILGLLSDANMRVYLNMLPLWWFGDALQRTKQDYEKFLREIEKKKLELEELEQAIKNQKKEIEELDKELMYYDLGKGEVAKQKLLEAAGKSRETEEQLRGSEDGETPTDEKEAEEQTEADKNIDRKAERITNELTDGTYVYLVQENPNHTHARLDAKSRKPKGTVSEKRFLEIQEVLENVLSKRKKAKTNSNGTKRTESKK